MSSLQTLHSFKNRLVEYLKLKVEQEDWHGVSDAANDIREVEAKMAILKEVKEEDQKTYAPKDVIPKDHPIMKHSK
jgi:hypothetical protein